MGTSAMYGFYKNGVTKATYSHSDGYPAGLGSEIVDFIKDTPVNELNQIFDKIVMVDRNKKATAKQIENCIEYFNKYVSTKKPTDWYCLLHGSQGNLNAYKSDLKYMVDSSDFIKDSLCCEWAYIINLDENRLEVYEGFQTEPQKNRYELTESDNDYYNCALIKTFDLNNIPSNWTEELPEN